MVTTAERLKELAARSPGLNLTEAAALVSVTRERVRQIANNHGLPFYRGHHRKARPVCDLCKEEVRQANSRRHMACIRKLARSPEQRAHCKAVAAESHRRWMEANRERWNEYARQYRNTNPEYAAYQARWRASNPDKIAQYTTTAAVRLLERKGYTILPPRVP